VIDRPAGSSTVGEHIAYDPGDLVDVAPAQAEVWEAAGVAEAAQKPPRPAPEPRTGAVTPPRTTRIGPKPK
jgi:hypothetical protein